MSYILSPYEELEFIPLLNLEHSRKTKDGWNFRCPVCGDSKKSEYKRRGWILADVDKIVYYCHNCHLSTTFRHFIKMTHPDVFDQYILKEKEVMLEKLKEGNFIRGKAKSFNIIDEKRERKLKLFKPNPKYFLPLPQHAIDYCKRRLIPDDIIERLFWTAKYDNKGEVWTYGDALCFPLWKGDEMYGFQIRKLDRKVYLTYCDQEEFKVYNIFNVDLSQPVFIFEAIIDSLAMDNSIAVLGSSIQDNVLERIEKPVFVFDNDFTGMEQAYKYVKAGHEVFVWPETVNRKDFNSLMVDDGWTTDQIRMMVLKNISSGFEAEVAIKLRMQRMKK